VDYAEVKGFIREQDLYVDALYGITHDEHRPPNAA
jgi:hypothetical protein